MGYLDPLLSFFKFTKDTDLVAATCLVLLLSSIIGGMLSSIFKAFGGPLKTVAFKETTGFRVLLFYELCLIALIFYYHFNVTGKIDGVQIIFWITTMLSMPVLWFIGSALTHVIFWAKINKNKKAYRDMLEKKKRKARDQIRGETRETHAARGAAGGGASTQAARPRRA